MIRTHGVHLQLAVRHSIELHRRPEWWICRRQFLPSSLDALCPADALCRAYLLCIVSIVVVHAGELTECRRTVISQVNATILTSVDSFSPFSGETVVVKHRIEQVKLLNSKVRQGTRQSFHVSPNLASFVRIFTHRCSAR